MKDSDLHLQLVAAKAEMDRPRLQRLLWHPIRTVAPRILAAAGLVRRIRVQTFFGAEMMVILPEVVSTLIYRYHCYEEDLSSAMICLLKQGNTFFDVGAHFGYVSLLAAKLVGPNGRVVAFEPTPRTRGTLEENVGAVSWVRVEPLAVWVNDAEIELRDFGPLRSAWNSFTGPRAPESQLQDFAQCAPFKVQATSIDAYVARCGIVPDFLKIDAESAEMNILLGAEQTLRLGRTVVFLEVGDYDIPGVASSRALIEHLQGLGFLAYEAREGRLQKHRPHDRYEYQNFAFIPTGRQVELVSTMSLGS